MSDLKSSIGKCSIGDYCPLCRLADGCREFTDAEWWQIVQAFDAKLADTEEAFSESIRTLAKTLQQAMSDRKV